MNPRVSLILAIVLAALAGYIYFFELGVDTKEVDDGPVQIYGPTYGEYDIVELEIARPQATAHFVRTNQTLTRDWEMLLPIPAPPDWLDQARVNGAATRMGKLTASQVITNVSNLAQYGLDPPQLTVTLTISNGQKIILYPGAETPIDNNRYLLTAVDEQSVYVISSFAIDDLRRLLDDPPLTPAPRPTITTSP